MSHLRLDTIDHLSDMTMTINASDTATYHDIFEQAKNMNAKTLNGGDATAAALNSVTSTFDSALLDQSWAFSSTSDSDIVGGGEGDNYSFSASSTIDKYYDILQQGGDFEEEEEDYMRGGEGESDDDEGESEEAPPPAVTVPPAGEEEEEDPAGEEEKEEMEPPAVVDAGVGGARRKNNKSSLSNRFTTGSRELSWMKNGSFRRNKNKFLFSDIEEEHEGDEDDEHDNDLSLDLSTSDLSMFKPY